MSLEVGAEVSAHREAPGSDLWRPRISREVARAHVEAAQRQVRQAYRDAARRGVKLPAQAPEVRTAKSRRRYYEGLEGRVA